MDEKRRLLKNTGVIALGNMGAKVISFLLLPLYTSILSTSEYGTYDFIVVVSAFLLPIVTLSMHEAMFRFIIGVKNNQAQFNEIISNAFAIVVLGVIVLLVILCVINRIQPIDNWIYIFIYVASSALYTFSNNLLRGMGRIKEYAIISSAKNLIQLLLNVISVAVFKWGVAGLLFSLCVSEVLAFLWVFITIRLWKRINISKISGDKIMEMLKYSLPLIPNTLSSQIINLSDRLIIKEILGVSENGIYSISYKFPNMIETVYHYFYTAWSESASRVLERGRKDAIAYYQSLYEVLDNMIFSVILLLTAGMPILFRLFIRGDYVQGFSYIPLLMFSMYFDSMGKFCSGIFTALKKTKRMATTTIIAAIVNVIINLVLIQSLGLYAAAGSTLISAMIMYLLRMVYIQRDIPIRINIKNIVVKLAGVVICALLYDYNNGLKTTFSIFLAMAYLMILNKALLCQLRRKIDKRIGS